MHNFPRPWSNSNKSALNISITLHVSLNSRSFGGHHPQCILLLFVVSTSYIDGHKTKHNIHNPSKTFNSDQSSVVAPFSAHTKVTLITDTQSFCAASVSLIFNQSNPQASTLTSPNYLSPELSICKNFVFFILCVIVLVV